MTLWDITQPKHNYFTILPNPKNWCLCLALQRQLEDADYQSLTYYIFLRNKMAQGYSSEAHALAWLVKFLISIPGIKK